LGRDFEERIARVESCLGRIDPRELNEARRKRECTGELPEDSELRDLVLRLEEVLQQMLASVPDALEENPEDRLPIYRDMR
jgi:hypothetical protein